MGGDLLDNDGRPRSSPSNRQSSIVISFLKAALVFICIPNLGFWLVTMALGLGRSFLNLDYIISGVAFAFGWRRTALLSLGLFMLVDSLNLVGQVWPFIRPQDVIYLATRLPQAAPIYQLAAVVSASFLLVSIYCFARWGAWANREGALVLFNLAILIYGVQVYVLPDEGERIWRAPSSKLVDSQSLDFMNLRLVGFAATAMMEGEAFQKVGFKGKTSVWQGRAPEELSPKLLLIVAESWGVMQNSALSTAIVAPLTSLDSRLAWIELGEMPFKGATVAGELRELCGLWPNHFNLKNAEDGLENCMAHALREKGYHTAAVHGAGGLMYDRAFWWPRAGFEEVAFSETRAWNSRCYSFPGVCDSEIASEYLGAAFAGDGKRFIYWLTLNSHSIYDERDLRARLIDCAAFDIEPDSEVCRMVNLHAQFFSDLAKVLKSPAFAGVEAIIVGDHQPPMLGAEAKQLHIKENMVSWAHFKVEDASKSESVVVVN